MTIEDLTQNSVAITVRGGIWDDDIFDQDWCNHAGAELEEVGNDGSEIDGSVELLVCDKCGAMLIGDSWVVAE